MKLCTVSFGALLLVTGASAGWLDNVSNFFSSASSAVGSIEEAPYNVTLKTDQYEQRNYPSKKWVCTSATGSTRKVAESEDSMFMRLFGYITGENSRDESIGMTAPVTTEYTISGSGTNTYTMCFYIGQIHQADPPSPTEADVFLQDARPAMTIYTRTVGGYIRSESAWMDEARALAELLEADGITASLDHMYMVGYDAPFKFWNRRNEVWFPVA